MRGLCLQIGKMSPATDNATSRGMAPGAACLPIDLS